MSRTTVPGRLCRPVLRRIAAVTALAVTVIWTGSIASAGAVCPDENLVPTQLSTREARDAVACLINEQRALSGLAALTAHPALQQAARKHSKAMNKRNFLGHGSPQRRVKRAGYGGRASAWKVGEVLGWGKGGSGSPMSLVTAWMGSPTHRTTLLEPGFQELGIGVVKGSPKVRARRPKSAIYTIDFGYRRP
ncbi:MAG: CAP domain-containing protein [Solirubrobacterales bacterium]